MSEPTNPLFEQEKAFLERKKLEYERALRGDVTQLKEQIKVQTANAGRVAMVGAGLAGSLWLITKVFSGGKRRRHTERDHEAGFDYYEPHSHHAQYFDDFDEDNELLNQDHQEDEHWHDADMHFGNADYFDSHLDDSHGAVYHSENDSYDSPATHQHSDNAAERNLHAHSDYSEPASLWHDEFTDKAGTHFTSEAYGHPESTLAYDDSRRLPHSEEFQEKTEDEELPISRFVAANFPHPPHPTLGSRLVDFAKSKAGKIFLGQALSAGMALATKVVADKLASREVKTTKYSDLAGLTGKNDGYAHGHPASSQPDVYHAANATSNPHLPA